MLRNVLIYVFVFRILCKLLLKMTENELCCEFQQDLAHEEHMKVAHGQ